MKASPLGSRRAVTKLDNSAVFVIGMVDGMQSSNVTCNWRCYGQGLINNNFLGTTIAIHISASLATLVLHNHRIENYLRKHFLFISLLLHSATNGAEGNYSLQSHLRGWK